MMKPSFRMPYTDWAFLFPPRPENAMTSTMIPSYEKQGFSGQFKMNGTCSLIGVSPTGVVHTLTRHNTPHKMWRLTDRTRGIADFCKRGSWTVFLAEVLNDKTPHIKDTIYLFDVIVQDSCHLVGVPYQDRLDFLAESFPVMEDTEPSHIVAAPGIWLAKTYEKGLYDLYQSIHAAGNRAHEGLVLKNTSAPLDLTFKAHNNQGWQVKVRVPLVNSHLGF